MQQNVLCEHLVLCWRFKGLPLKKAGKECCTGKGVLQNQRSIHFFQFYTFSSFFFQTKHPLYSNLTY